MKTKSLYILIIILALSLATSLPAQTEIDLMENFINNLGLDPAEYFFDEGCKKFEEGDRQKAFDYWVKAHEAGSIDASYWLGECLFSGWGTEQDPKKAFEFLEYAANKGQVDACYLIGAAYTYGFSKNGIEIQVDNDRGMEWNGLALPPRKIIQMLNGFWVIPIMYRKIITPLINGINVQPT